LFSRFIRPTPARYNGFCRNPRFAETPRPQTLKQAAHHVTTSSLALPLTEEQIRSFQHEGYLVLRHEIASNVIQQIRRVTEIGLAQEIPPYELEAELHYPGAPDSVDDEGGRTIRRLKNAVCRDPIFTELLNLPVVIGSLHQLLGPQVVMPFAHHNCVMTKQPRYSSNTLWHQDIRYWSYQRPDLISLWIPLGEEHPENGCLYVIPGTHKMQFDRSRLDEMLFLRTELPENRELLERRIAVELSPGDLLLFHCRTFHAAGKNMTEETKMSAVFTFRDAANLPVAGSRSASMPELLLPAPR